MIPPLNINPPTKSSGTAFAGASSANSTTSSPQIAGNFTQFLTLLTTQLKNQNPLSPMDTNQFTQQLVQFAQVEQQLKSNDRLDAIASSAKNSEAASLSSYIGKSITTDGITSELGSAGATWNLSAPRAASKATITISDSKNNVVGIQTQHLLVIRIIAWSRRSHQASPWCGMCCTDCRDQSAQSVCTGVPQQGRRSLAPIR